MVPCAGQVLYKSFETKGKEEKGPVGKRVFISHTSISVLARSQALPLPCRQASFVCCCGHRACSTSPHPFLWQELMSGSLVTGGGLTNIYTRNGGEKRIAITLYPLPQIHWRVCYVKHLIDMQAES